MFSFNILKKFSKLIHKIFIEGVNNELVKNSRELKLLRLLNYNNNIIKYFEDYMDSSFLYIVFEHFEVIKINNIYK